MDGIFYVLREHYRCSYLTVLQSIMNLCPHPYRVRSQVHGFSHGLKKCPPDTFLPSLRSGRPFKSTLLHQKRNPIRMDGISFWRSRRDLNPRYPFGVHTISSRARYDHFDTAPCRRSREPART